MHSTWLNSSMISKPDFNFLFFFTFFDAHVGAVSAHQSCTFMAWHWHWVLRTLRWHQSLWRILCFRAPNTAEGHWKAPNMAWSHSCHLLHAFPGVYHSIMVRFQLSMEIAGLLGNKMVFYAVWANRTWKGMNLLTVKICYRLLFRFPSDQYFTSWKWNWLIILKPCIW